MLRVVVEHAVGVREERREEGLRERAQRLERL